MSSGLIIQPRIARFRSNFVQILITWLYVPRTSKDNGSKVKVSPWDNVSASKKKSAIIQARISCRMSNYVKITPQPSATQRSVQVHKVKHWNRNNFAADCSIAFKFGIQSFITSQAIRCKCSTSKVKRQGHRVKGHEQQKRSTAIDRFSDFKLGMAS